jgi:hypothetical protein
MRWRFIRNGGSRFTSKKFARQPENVFVPLAQWRYAHLDDVDAVIQVFAELGLVPPSALQILDAWPPSDGKSDRNVDGCRRVCESAGFAALAAAWPASQQACRRFHRETTCRHRPVPASPGLALVAPV